MRTVILLPLVVALVAPAAAPAQARVSAPVLRTRYGSQEGTVNFTEDSERAGQHMCSGMIADGAYQRPEALRHDGGPVTWTIADRRHPSRVTLSLTRHPVRGVRLATERVDDVPVQLRALTSSGKTVGWEVTTGPVGNGDIDLVLSVRWPDACGGDETSRNYRVFAP